jgi:hypothetical protein
VVESSSIPVLSALAAQKGLYAFHLDVDTAFLYGHLEEHILVELLPGFPFPQVDFV